MANIFQNILVSKPKKSVFDLSYENKLSFEMGKLVPMYLEHVVPGDKFRVKSEVFLRFAPMLSPVMHRVNCYVHYFFVPYRLIWDDWQEFITGGEDGLSQPVFPRTTFTETDDYVGPGTLADYLGYNFPNSSNTNPSVLEYSLLPFRAYQNIYNDYYRDQNLTEPVQFSKMSGAGESRDQILGGTDYPTTSEGYSAAKDALTALRSRAWEKDYFTSALPFVQRGVASQIPVSLDVSNLGLDVPTDFRTDRSFINRAYDINNPTTSLPGDDVYIRTDGTLSTNSTVEIALANRDQFRDGYSDTQSQTNSHYHNINKTDFAGVKIKENSQGVTITPPTINELRLAEHIQRWLEKNARGGARYIEQILAHFGVRVPDYRLDRPEYLGGGKSPVVISEVLQTSASDVTSKQGNMAGHGYSVGSENKFKYTFDEHGIVMGIISVLPRTSYQDGVSRHLLKFDKFDYYFPEFAHLGEQAVLNAELYNGTLISDDPSGTFGYQERYAEYKYRSGEVHGDFKSSLSYWHLGRMFNSTPQLNTSFVTSDPRTNIFAVTSGQHMWCQIFNSVRAVRPMPKHAIPSL